MDKEIADKLGKPVWTVRTHKKHIYHKLGIGTTSEIVLYMVADYIGIVFNRKLVKEYGLKAIFGNDRC